MPKNKASNNEKKYEETREWRIQNQKKEFPLKKVSISILIILIIAAAIILLIFAISKGNIKT